MAARHEPTVIRRARRAVARRHARARVGRGARHRLEVLMKVYIIGAGPGDPDLITVKGADLVARCPVVLYTGSLVPEAVIARARKDAKVLDSSGMTLDEIVDVIVAARDGDQDVARVHTGDP